MTRRILIPSAIGVAAILCELVLFGSPFISAQDDDIALSVYRILDAVEFPPERGQKLLALGKKAHPTFAKILNDEKSSYTFVTRVLKTLSKSKEDRSEFVEPTVARLNDADWVMRMAAAELIGDIGTAKEAPPLIALLYDEESGAAGAAALALGKIGGQRELLALTIWQRNNAKSEDVETIKDVNKAIEQIRKRIEKKK